MTRFFAARQAAQASGNQDAKPDPFAKFGHTALDRKTPQGTKNVGLPTDPYVPKPPTKVVGGRSERHREEIDIRNATKLYGHYPSNAEMTEYRKLKMLAPQSQQPMQSQLPPLQTDEFLKKQEAQRLEDRVRDLERQRQNDLFNQRNR